jgi:hypothetical protein
VEQILPGREGEGRSRGVGWGKVTQTMYTHVNKCKSDNIKKIF